MQEHRMLKIGLVALVIVCVTTPTQAILGVGDIVYDPAVYAESVEQIVRLEQQYAEMVQSYQMLQNQYEQLRWMAQQDPVNMAVRYRTLASPWRNVTASDTYGVTGGWVSSINSGVRVADGYLSAVEGLGTYGAAFADLPADQQARLKTNYATVELADGANQSALDALGRLRANAPATELAIQGLESDSLSSDPDMNTEVAVLNKINAANVMAVRTGRDTNQLLIALAEQNTIESKRIRDAEAGAFNQHIRFRQEGKALLTAQAAGASQAMLDWKMP